MALKDPRRIAWNALAALSLLLCLVAVAARVAVPRMPRDALVGQKINTLSDQTRVKYNFGLTAYGLSFDRSRELIPGMAASRKVLPDLDGFGFRLYSGPMVSTVFAVFSGRDVIFQRPYDYFSVLVPYWAVALLAFALPLVYLLAVLRRSAKHQRDDLCAACGYDLRATPNRCPECGAFPHASAKLM